MINKAMNWKQRVTLTGALAFFSQTALSAGAGVAGNPEVITVTAPRVETAVRESRIEADVATLIKAINQRIERDQANDLKAIGAEQIKLVISEAPTRG